MDQVRLGLSDEHEIAVLDPLKMGVESARFAILKQDYDLLITYNKTGTELTENNKNKNLLSILEKPQFSWLTEHPVTFFDQYIKTNSIFRNYILPNAIHKFFANEMGLQGEFHDLLFASSIKEVGGNYSKRPYDICIAAQWRGPADANAFWLKMPPGQRQFFEDINVLQHLEENGDVFTAFLAAAEHHGVSLSCKKDFSLALKALYWHARKTERIQLVQDLVNSNLKILLIGGEEWKRVLPAHSNVTFVPPCSHRELTSYYMQSRAVASTNCFNGANERTFDALSCGSISLAENSPTLKKFFSDTENIIFYSHLRARDEIQRITDILNNPTKSEDIAERGRQTFLNGHTWKHRAIELSKIIKSNAYS